MLAISALLAAFSIAGAFWVGVLAARRIRDFGEGQRALDQTRRPLALAAAAGQEAAAERVRASLAERLVEEGILAELLDAGGGARDGADALGPFDLRRGDVVSVDAADPAFDGDAVVAWTIHLREGPRRRAVVGLEDGADERLLVATEGEDDLLLLVPVPHHDLAGEPPRQIVHEGAPFYLARRGQAAAAGMGPHGRPEQPRVAIYFYEAADDRVAFVERWGHRVFLAVGRRLPSYTVQFLPAT